MMMRRREALVGIGSQVLLLASIQKVVAEDAYPTDQKLSPMYFNRGDRVIIGIVTVDDELEIKLNDNTVAHSNNFSGWETFDITHNLTNGANDLAFICTDYGGGGENYWSLKAGIVSDLNTRTLANVIDLHYRRVGQHDQHATVTYQFQINIS